jgi:haloalkane dehalogenase
MHYVDVGEGRPIVFLHGSPTWSFLYRKLIATLSKEYRCIGVDHLGFGLSDKPTKADYRPAAHTWRLETFIESLDLKEVTIVSHDFGGPIGMDWASQNPHRFRDMVMFNTWCWPLHDSPVIRKVKTAATSKLNTYWFRLLNPSPKFYLPILFADNHCLPMWVQDQFQHAFNNQFETYGPEALAKAWVSKDGWFEAVAENYAALHKSTLLLWGEDDITYGENALDRMLKLIPHAASVKLPKVGNYVPEEAPDAGITHIRRFIS